MMNEEKSSTSVTPELLKRLEDAAVCAAREIISGRRIIDVEGAYGLGLTTIEVGNDGKCREPGPEEASKPWRPVRKNSFIKARLISIWTDC